MIKNVPFLSLKRRRLTTRFKRLWCNGSRAGFRNQSERVGVRVPPVAPIKDIL